MIITVQDILDYLHCPMLYKLKKQHNLPEKSYPSIDDKYINELKRMIYFFFEQVKNHGYCKSQLLKDKWKDLWIGERSKKDILLPTEDPIKGWYRKRERDGWNAMLSIWDEYSEEKTLDSYEIIGTEIPFTLPIINNIIITGKLPVVRLRDNKVDVMLFRHSDSLLSFDRDIEATIYSMAYRKLFNSKEDQITLYLLDKEKEFVAKRLIIDQEMAEETVEQIVRGVENKVFPRVLNKKCDSCPYYYACRGKERPMNN